MVKLVYLKVLAAGFLIAWSVISVGAIVFAPGQSYFQPYYTEETYHQLERLYNQSQYRLKNPTSLIADEIVFRYAAGAYIRGTDPILVNSEHTPLGKYLIGLSFLWFQNDGVVILVAALLSMAAIYLIGLEVLKDKIWALVPVALFSTEELFRNQLRVTPLLDIIQLPFILLALLVFPKELKHGRFFWTSLAIGLVAATKSVVPALLLVATFGAFLLWKKAWLSAIKFVPWLFLSLGILMLSYLRTFLNGYDFVDFFRFQKWIFLYQQSKLVLPFSFWKLMLLNQWQTWWGDMKVQAAADWRITWPILVMVPFILVVLVVKKRLRLSQTSVILLCWVLLYETFLSVGVVMTRFLLPLIPVLYILATFLVKSLVHQKRFRL